jgi:hypothetical protein
LQVDVEARRLEDVLADAPHVLLEEDIHVPHDGVAPPVGRRGAAEVGASVAEEELRQGEEGLFQRPVQGRVGRALVEEAAELESLRGVPLRLGGPVDLAAEDGEKLVVRHVFLPEPEPHRLEEPPAVEPGEDADERLGALVEAGRLGVAHLEVPGLRQHREEAPSDRVLAVEAVDLREDLHVKVPRADGDGELMDV